MTIQQILARRNVLIRESAALKLLGIPNREPARQWLRARLKWHLGQLPRQTYLFTHADVKRLREELEELAKLRPPSKSRPKALGSPRGMPKAVICRAAFS